jgi:hypothetical protein
MLDDLPEHLYHYTDAGGLYGILTSEVLWATHIAFLNDTREAFYGAGAWSCLTSQATGERCTFPP